MVARKLNLYETYSRQDVHDIFEPSTRFRSKGGTWGLWTVVPITKKLGNYVFFITIDPEQVGDRTEWIPKKGILNWQSQPQQSLADYQIKQFIHHDSKINDIYLFLRMDTTFLYAYMGRLAYLKHNPDQECPVVIQWKTLDWNPPPELFQSMKLNSYADNPRPSPHPTNTRSSEKVMKSRTPNLYEKYSRQEVHDLLEPSTRFTPQAGIWGLWGIIPIIKEPGNFVFFVTFGKEQAGYHFDEWINDKGVINWQSQPRQGLDDRQIQQFIHHIPAKNDIYLFLRTQKSDLYTYLGKLAYFSHDSKLERPVHIQWQILDWAPPPGLLQSMVLNLITEEPQFISQPTDRGTFEWRGVQYPISREEVQDKIRKLIRSGLPLEATRYRDWFIYMNGERLSPKWVFHLITNADYSEFDAPTAREKLEKLGIKSYLIAQSSQLTLDTLPKNNISDDVDNNHQIQEGKTEYIKVSVPTSRTIRVPKLQQPQLNSLSQGNNSPDEDDDQKPHLPEIKMRYKRKYIGYTIDKLTNLILDLAQLGEIESISPYLLGESHLVQLVQSSWAILTPYSLVATPQLINVLPIESKDVLYDLLHLYRWDFEGWGNFEQKAFHLPFNPRFPNLGQDYIYSLKPDSIVDEKICRPVWLVNYMPESDWEDWEVSKLMEADPSRRSSKFFVHSVLPIQNIYGGILEVQEAIWKSAFYWLMLQLLVLSDPETGAAYDPRISLALSDGWRDGSIARLFLQGEYIGDLTDNLEALLSPFKWVWVNRSHDDNQDQLAVLGLLRLLLKIDIAKLGNEGRLQFTDSYRNQLFQSQTKAQFYYRGSKEARDKLRDTIKEMGR